MSNWWWIRTTPTRCRVFRPSCEAGRSIPVVETVSSSTRTRNFCATPALIKSGETINDFMITKTTIVLWNKGRMSGRCGIRIFPVVIMGLMLLAHGGQLSAAESASFQVCVSNEKAGTITLIDGVSRQALTNLAIGKRPRGIHASPDGKLLYVALSGTPISGPPELDAKGNPIFRKDDDDAKSDHSADGIAVLDLRARRLLRRM